MLVIDIGGTGIKLGYRDQSKKIITWCQKFDLFASDFEKVKKKHIHMDATIVRTIIKICKYCGISKVGISTAGRVNKSDNVINRWGLKFLIAKKIAENGIGVYT